MNRIASFFETLHKSRQREAERVIRRYWHLVKEAHAYDRKREIEADSNDAGRPSQKSFITDGPLCSPQI